MQNIIKKSILFIVFLIIFPQFLFAENSDAKNSDEIIKKIEEKYINETFSAFFIQTSTLKAMDMTDNAFGRVIFKYPDKMLWKYEKPDPQKIFFDGKTLWIYNEADNQAMVGDGTAFFKDGKGASFLTDIKNIKKKFLVELTGSQEKSYKLKLTPLKKAPDISYIELTVLKESFNIIQTAFFNDYGDENILLFSEIKFLKNIDDSIFRFSPPEGVDVVRLDN